MLAKSICEGVLARALSRGGTFAEIFYEDTKSFGMTLRSGRIENAAVSRPRGAGIRVYDGLRSIYVYTCDVSLSGLMRAAGAMWCLPKRAFRIFTRSKRR